MRRSFQGRFSGPKRSVDHRRLLGIKILIERGQQAVAGAEMVIDDRLGDTRFICHARQRQRIGAFGPLIGGMLLRHFEWGVVFLINVPVVLAFLIVAPILLREVRSTTYGRIDLLSLLLSFVGILLFTWSLKTAAAEGFTLMQVAGGIIGITALALFLRRQTRIDYPLLDLSLFGDRIFSIAILMPVSDVTFVPFSDEPEPVPFSAVWSPFNQSTALRNLLDLAGAMERQARKG